MRIYLSYRYHPNATAVYFERAFSQNHDVIYAGSATAARVGYPSSINLPDLLTQSAPSPDLILFVDPAGEFFPTGWEKVNCPTAIYLVDVHLNFELRAKMAPFFDYIFVAQKDYVERFRQMGFQQVHWLPLACDLDIHGGQSHLKEWDIGFVGHVHSPERARRLSLLASRYNVNDYLRSYSKDQITDVYSRSKIVFNTSIKGDLNMRVFEALASGSMLLTDRISNGQADLFQAGVHLVEYTDEQSLLEQADYYLAHPDERELIASQGYQVAAQQHTYSHRAQAILDAIFTEKGPSYTAKARQMTPADVCRAYAKVYAQFQMVDALLYQFRLAWRMRQGYLPILSDLFWVFSKRIYQAIRYH